MATTTLNANTSPSATSPSQTSSSRPQTASSNIPTSTPTSGGSNPINVSTNSNLATPSNHQSKPLNISAPIQLASISTPSTPLSTSTTPPSTPPVSQPSTPQQPTCPPSGSMPQVPAAPPQGPAGSRKQIHLSHQAFAVWIALAAALGGLVVAVYYGELTKDLGTWTAHNDFRESCKSELAAGLQLPIECNIALGHPIKPPPIKKRTLERPWPQQESHRMVAPWMLVACVALQYVLSTRQKHVQPDPIRTANTAQPSSLLASLKNTVISHSRTMATLLQPTIRKLSLIHGNWFTDVACHILYLFYDRACEHKRSTTEQRYAYNLGLGAACFAYLGVLFYIPRVFPRYTVAYRILHLMASPASACICSMVFRALGYGPSCIMSLLWGMSFLLVAVRRFSRATRVNPRGHVDTDDLMAVFTVLRVTYATLQHLS